MSDWTAGYVADVDYTYGYYRELNPLRIALAFICVGLAAPSQGTACELGFGQGVSTNLHAAAQASIKYWGTDFNPAQAAHAQSLAYTSGSGARLYEEAFEQFCQRSDLPDFDFIGLHGIWSWISDDNRHIIVDFIRRKLKAGGVLYVSYNTMPGWGAMVPLRHLLTQHAEIMSAPGQGTAKKIETAIEFTEQLLASKPGFAIANTAIDGLFKSLKTMERHYLAHEYFNRDWHPMYFSTMNRWLEPAKLSYACSANYIDHFDLVNLTAQQQALLREIPDTCFRETTRDMLVNQNFRKDYWVKGERRLNLDERNEALRHLRMVLVAPRKDIPMKIKGALGEGDLNTTMYAPILDFMADHVPRTFAEIEQATKSVLNFGKLTEAILTLHAIGALAAAQNDEAIATSRAATDRLNAALLERARYSKDVHYLASPVTGGGIDVNRVYQLFLFFRAQGLKDPLEGAEPTWQLLASQGRHMLDKDGRELMSHEENLAELKVQAQHFAEVALPVLKKLQVVA